MCIGNKIHSSMYRIDLDTQQKLQVQVPLIPISALKLCSNLNCEFEEVYTYIM